MKGKSKILVEDKWFEEYKPGSFLEDDLEKTIIAQVGEVFPDFFILPYKLTVRTADGESSKPDLALVRRDYTEWYVVEVELGHKGWKGHTEKQVRVFSSGIYPHVVTAEYFMGKEPTLDRNKLHALIKNYYPKVLIIVNDHPAWAEDAKQYSASLLIFQMYNSDRGDIYRIDGDYPYVFTGRSRCRFPKYPANILEIDNPSILKILHGEHLQVVFKGKIGIWERLDDGLTVFLIPRNLNPLPVTKEYYLFITSGDEFFFEIA